MSNPFMHQILVVDDLADNLFLLQTLLETEGYRVETADNGELALKKLQKSPPDLVLLDVMMPDMTGYEVTQKIRQNSQHASIPILLITAYDEATVAQGLAVGADDFIHKPVDFDQLINRIQSFLAEKSAAHTNPFAGYGKSAAESATQPPTPHFPASGSFSQRSSTQL